MEKMEKLLKKNKKLVHEIAERNTIRNQNGEIVISKNDPWVLDDSWDKLYSEVSDGQGNKTERDMVSEFPA